MSAQGSTNYAAIRPHYVLEYTIPLPPLDEQRRLVARIEELFAKIEEALQLRSDVADEVHALFDAVRARVFERHLGRGSARLDEVATLTRGRFSHRPRNEPRFFGGDHPWIQIGEIEQSGKYITEWSQSLNDDGLNISRKFDRGTVLVSIAATIGAVGILGFDCCIPDSVVAIRPHSGVNAEFIYYYMGYIRSHLDQLAPQSAQKNVNLRILSSLPFPDIVEKEQAATVCYLDVLADRISMLDSYLAGSSGQINALADSVLNAAFNGNL